MDDQLTQSVCTVGGNAVSAFLSWRLSATNACDVTLVWKSGFDTVSQYGISFRYVTMVLLARGGMSNIVADLTNSATSASNQDTVCRSLVGHQKHLNKAD